MIKSESFVHRFGVKVVLNSVEPDNIRKVDKLTMEEMPVRSRCKCLFELRRGNRPSYYLFFGTNSIRGLEKMKDAMWKVDPTGNYTICDNYYGRQTLFQPEPDYNQLKQNIQNDLTGKVMKIEKLLDWVLVETAFRKAGIKNNVLKSMEKNDQLKVIKSSRKRNYSYPDGTIVKIL